MSTGVPTEIRFRNDVGKTFRFVGAEIFLDGRRIHAATAPSDAREIATINREMLPGSHVLTARVEFQGRNRGPFNYLDAYHFHVETTGAFVVPDNGRQASFTVVTRERKGMNVPMDKRLEVAIELAPTR